MKVKRAEAKKRRREKNRSLAGKLRDGREEFAGVGILRLLKDFFGGPGFDELARVHDGDACSQLGHDGQAMRNEDVREREFALEFLERQEHLGADGNVEGGNRFVGSPARRTEAGSSRPARAWFCRCRIRPRRCAETLRSLAAPNQRAWAIPG